MILEPYLRDITSKINTGDTFYFYYGSRDWQNLVADEVNFPAVFVDFIPAFKFDLPKAGYIGERYNTSIYVAFKSEMAWTTLEHEVVIDKATKAARNIISQLQRCSDTNRNKVIDEIKFINGGRVILRENDDVGTSGVAMLLEIVPALDLPVCV